MEAQLAGFDFGNRSDGLRIVGTHASLIVLNNLGKRFEQGDHFAFQ
jgi:hypothetical protein